MKKLILKTQSETKTEIYIGHNIQQKINSFIDELSPTKIIYITDENLINKLKKYLNVKDERIIVLKSGEKEKNIENINNIVQILLTKNIDRDSLIVAFGGGVISDTSGFAASIFYRGIPIVFIPTTLLAQVDAAIGGKNTINVDKIKNILGTFYQPRAIFIDTANLKGLPKSEFASGTAEIIKYGIGFDKSILKSLTNNEKLLEIVTKSVNIKKEIVKLDQIETKGIRKLLNLGHTLGHALESKSQLKLSHGEGVSIGLHFSCFVAHQLGNISKKELQKVSDTLKKYDLPIFTKFDPEEIINKISYDKKKSGDTIDFVTIKKIGKAYIHKMKINDLKKYFYEFKRHCERQRSNPVKLGITLSRSPRRLRFSR